MGFGEQSSPTDVIRAILDEYPFSIGLFRELLQNSDDAGASKQVFALDLRKHPCDSICDPSLRDSQGPALLAYNDAVFSKEDWMAIQTLHRSSKKADTSKIGKFGIGFRSCYHTTDNPQILSGSKLGILDPHHRFGDTEDVQPGGAQIDLRVVNAKYKDHLAAFEGLGFEQEIQSDVFQGTIIRLPLRLPSAQSEISKRSVDPEDIRQLLKAFVQDEIGISMLFLKHIQSIEIVEIREDGTHAVKASATKCADKPGVLDNSLSIHPCTITIGESRNEWLITNELFDAIQSLNLLSKVADCDVSEVVARDKLIPEISIAIPASPSQGIPGKGRLFTYLPLPIATGFPFHIHSLFALTPSRQNLRNQGEAGLVAGSRDSILIHWNSLLFSTYLPQMWARMLAILPRRGWCGENIYDAWPPHQADVSCGEGTYWSDLPVTLFDTILEQSLCVWPVRDTNIMSNIESTCVARCDADPCLLSMLACTGIDIVQPPSHIFDIIAPRTQIRVLAPTLVHQILVSEPWKVLELDRSQRLRLMSYLCTTSDVALLAHLPLFEVLSGAFISLQPRSEGCSYYYNLMTPDECNLFKRFDEQALNINALPREVVDLITREQSLNVRRLSPAIICELLQGSYGFWNIELEQHLPWLSEFWDWAGAYTSADLINSIRHLYIFPTSCGLRNSKEGVFDRGNVEHFAVQGFQTLGAPFVHSQLSTKAIKTLRKFRILKSAMNIPVLLSHLDVDHFKQLSGDEVAAILSHIVVHLPNSCREIPLQPQQKDFLEMMPIYKHYTAGSAVFEAYRKNLKGYDVIYIVDVRVVGPRVFLPAISGAAFLDGAVVNECFLKCISTRWKVVHLVHQFDILRLAAVNLVGQQPAYLSAFLEYLIAHRNELPPDLFERVKEAPFILSKGGSLCSPRCLLDPSSPIANLFPKDFDKFPSGDSTIVQAVQVLELFQSQLSLDIVRERIFSIAKKPDNPDSIVIALALLRLIDDTNLDCAGLNVPLDTAWLPTQLGLKPASQCSSRWFYNPALYDHVLESIHEDAHISPSLRTALGWHKPLPLKVVIEQFKAVLHTDGPPHDVLRVIISELAKWATAQQVEQLIRPFTSDRPWVPTEDGYLKCASHALLQPPPIFLSGFRQISYGLLSDKGIVKFLRRMGCSDFPSFDALLSELRRLKDHHPLNVSVAECVGILTLLSDRRLDDEELALLLIPDEDSVLRPWTQIAFNDLGDETFLIDKVSDLHLTHPLVGDELASKLRITRLGLEESLKGWDSMCLGEGLVDRVRGVLKQYTEQQAIGEFLANAYDAQATEFGILVDEQQHSTQRLLSSTLQYFQTCPALVVYNDRTFSEDDLQGIHRVAVGGKQNKTDTIGQFGLGALAMFHFSEMAMIVSGEHVLFLDPSSIHLPGGRTSINLPLAQVGKRWPGHLASLHGLFGFNSESTCYDGTLFRLPLRTSSHVHQDQSIIMTPLSANHVLTEVVQTFASKAIDSMLFTQILHIFAQHRNIDGDTSCLWTVSAQRPLDEGGASNGGYYGEIIRVQGQNLPDLGTINEEWIIASVSIPSAMAPPDLSSLFEDSSYRLRSPIRVALGAQLSPKDLGPNHPRLVRRLFSTLPLPIKISIPVNISASFILAPDRRNIRLDEYNNQESQYNRWILGSVVPQLYLYLLDLSVMKEQTDPFQWWPSHRSRSNINGDALSRLCVEAFYSKEHLGGSQRRIFRSIVLPNTFLDPQTAVSMTNSSLRKVLEVLGNIALVRLPKDIRDLAKTLQKDDVQFVINEVRRQNCQWFTDRFLDEDRPIHVEEHLSITDIDRLISFIISEGVSGLHHLPLLPLANGVIREFEPTQANMAVYYIMNDKGHRKLFRPDRIVHPKLNIGRLLDGLNVAYPDSKAISNLIADKLPRVDDFEASDSECHWIAKFWNQYHSLSMESIDIELFPLVPTIKSEHYVSLRYCTQAGSPVFLVDNGHPSWLPDVLYSFCIDVRVVMLDDLPRPLRDILRTNEDRSFNINLLLNFLEPLSSDFRALFAGLGVDIHTKLAEWLRSYIPSSPSTPFKVNVARALPIWPTFENGVSTIMLPANNINMLPRGISEGVIKQLLHKHATTPYHARLTGLGIQPLDYSAVLTILESEWRHTQLPAELYTTYKSLISWLTGADEFRGRSLLVPDATSLLVKSDTLYERHVLFLDAFNNDPGYFLHPDFMKFEPILRGSLKQYSDLDMDLFCTCAQAIHDAGNSPRLIERARTVFGVYCEDLPLRIRWHQKHLWSLVAHLRFIPRNITNAEFNLTQVTYLPEFPDIVAPNQLVRKDLESIAWTQRARFSSEPSDRVLSANPELGLPTADEVAQHLRVLATMAQVPGSPLYSNFVVDLIATYDCLDSCINDFTRPSSWDDELLFLNVDDPSQDEWTWRSGKELFFNIVDSDTVWAVRKLLQPFRNLLLASGVDDIVNPSCPELQITPSELKLQTFRTKYEKMREEGKLIDVIFEAEGKKFPAHRSFLATISEYFEHMFCKDFGEAGPGVVHVELDRGCLTVSAVLDYIYQDKAPDSESYDCNQLLDILSLTHYWQVSDLHELIQNEIIKGKMIQPYTYLGVLQRARMFEGSMLITACEEYQAANSTKKGFRQLRDVED